MNAQEVSADPTGFLSLGLSPKLVDLLVERKIDAPTEIQRQLIPQVLAGRDCRAITRTGSGKTNAYLLPLIQMVKPGEGLQALILLPTREVAAQAQRNLERHSQEFPLHVRVATSSRGRPIHAPHGRERESHGLPNILLGTPGAIRGLARHEKLDLSTVRVLVMDEADSLLEGSSPDAIQELISHVAPDRQVIIFASEFDEALTALADHNQREPVLVEAQPQSTPIADVDQRVLTVAPDRRYEAVMGLLKNEQCKAVCVFAAHDNDVEQLARRLGRAGIEPRWLNGTRPDERRPPRRDERGRGRDGHRDRHDGDRDRGRQSATVYLSIDPPPRRLSATMLTHAIHLDLPHNPDVYAERIERCARLNRRGFSMLLLTPRDAESLPLVEERVGKPLTPFTPDWAGGFAPDAPREEPRARGERRDTRDGGRRQAPPSAPAAQFGEVRSAPAALVSPAPQPELPCSQRLLQPLRRNEEIEAAGIVPLPRTLASRFRPAKSTREGKPKFARGLPRRWR